MKNLTVNLPLVDGGLLPLEFSSGEHFIQQLAGPVSPPPVRIEIEAKTETGETITISIPYDTDGQARAWINRG